MLEAHADDAPVRNSDDTLARVIKNVRRMDTSYGWLAAWVKKCQAIRVQFRAGATNLSRKHIAQHKPRVVSRVLSPRQTNVRAQIASNLIL
jgi:hypothetical protein